MLIKFCFLTATLAVACVVSSPASDRHSVSKRVSNLPIISGDDDANSLGMLKYKKWRLEPVEVKQVESYENGVKAALPPNKRKSPIQQQQQQQQHTFTSQSSSRSSYSNINGNVDTANEQKHTANQDGQLLDRIYHSGAGQAYLGKPRHTQELTELRVPSLGLDQRVLERDGQRIGGGEQQQDDRARPGLIRSNDKVFVKKNNKRPDSASILQVSSMLATYIQQTGDQEGVADYIKQMIDRGQLREEEALKYLNTIQEVLAREQEEEEEQEREQVAQQILNFSDYVDRKYANGEMSPPVYKDIKDRLMETVMERAETDPKFLASPLDQGY